MVENDNYEAKEVYDNLVIGLTGPFGSGCSKVAEILESKFGCVKFSLSDYLKKEWTIREKKPIKKATKSQLQKLGNDLRKHNGCKILAEKVFEKAKDVGKKPIVIDSIRNEAEVQFFRERFPNFFLIAVSANEKDRWERVAGQYDQQNLTHLDFKENDKIDQNEENINYGQQVMLCVNEADVLIWNENKPMATSKLVIERNLEETLRGYIELFEGECRTPTSTESYMGIAYSAALMSHCYKRQVGAIILDENNDVISIGYNQNPPPLKPCYEEFGRCHREIYIQDLMAKFKACPLCEKKLEGLFFPYECPHCEKNVYREFVKDKAMSRCTALHAEEQAIINARRNLKGCTMYVTTFPCFTCAQKILDVGIKTIYYTESYTDEDSVDLLNKAQVNLMKFNGVKARAYLRLFGGWRRWKEKEVEDKQKSSNK